MKKWALIIGGTLAIGVLAFVFFGRGLMFEEMIGEDEENEMYDGPQMALDLEVEKTKDPALGYVPSERLIDAIAAAADSKRDEAARRSSGRQASPTALTWIERGSDSDSTGPSNGNTRANGGITAGRIRAVLVDGSDATGKTVWVGGVDGGLWKTADITASPASWSNVNDNLANLAISDIFQQPGDPNIMYFSTGEGYLNGDAVYGNGLFRSTDHGVTWAQVSATAGMTINRIAGDAAGNVYIGLSRLSPTNSGGSLLRTANGGASFTDITPSGLSGANARIADLKLSSTGRLHVTTALNTTGGVYRFTDSPETVTAATWTAATTPFPYPSGATARVELGVSGNTLYSLPSNTSAQVPTIYKSTDGGVTWAAVTAPSSTWASGQAWYSLSIAINPTNADQLVIGGLDTWRSMDGGLTWTKLSSWVGTTGQYVHADQHKAIWYDGGNKLLFASDGGVFFSTDNGATIRDRNTGLRLKQFYSVAAHPTSANYFLAGAQDNGTHQFNNPGLGASVEVTGGDGAFTAIDQDEPQYQFGAYVYNQYRRSTNGGASWSNVNFSSSAGMFINPFEYDTVGNHIYASDVSGSFRRWNNPQTGNSSDVISITNLSGIVSSIAVSPYTANRVYLGTNAGKVIRIDGADTVTAGSAGTDLSAGLPGGYVSNITIGANDNDLMAILSNYGINNVWVSTNGGTSWTASDGNLPDMPVRWSLFQAGDDTKAFIATETGVWETDALAGASTVWVSNSTFPNVRTDMIRYRSSDHTIAAATHGRGLWTASQASPFKAAFDYDGDGKTDASVYRPSQDVWYLLRSTDGFAAYQFGAAGDTLVPADYTGDGKTDVAIWRPSTGGWFILRSEDFTVTGGGFGQTGDTAAPGDYDGDGKADLAVYRPGAQSTFFVQESTNGFVAFSFGIAEDKPTLGDFDGDGKTDFAVYRPSQGAWYRFNSSDNSFYAVQFGAAGDKVVPADYTGDGKTDVAIWRESSGVWFVLKSDDLQTVTGGGFGNPGDIPTPGDYDGDGKTDFAVYRSGAQGVFYTLQTTNGFTAIPWGLAGDIPTPNAYVK